MTLMKPCFGKIMQDTKQEEPTNVNDFDDAGAAHVGEDAQGAAMQSG